jgi:hypothetical protein
MKKSVGALAVIVLLAGSMRAAADDIRIHFGQPEYVPPTTAFVPEAHRPEYAPPGTYTLGIWADLQVDFSGPEPAMDDWNGLNIAITSTIHPVTVSELVMDNFDHRIGIGTAYRWEASSDLGGGDNEFFLVAVQTAGLGGLYPVEFGTATPDWWSYATGVPGEPGAHYHYWLGNVTLSSDSPAEVWFNIGAGGVARRGGSIDDRVFFGETETVPSWPPVPWPPLPSRDFVFTPEPVSLLLLAVAGFVLRRR